jgi:hypothetical protein
VGVVDEITKKRGGRHVPDAFLDSESLAAVVLVVLVSEFFVVVILVLVSNPLPGS